MPRGKKFTAEQVIGKLREAEVGLAQGKTVPEVVRKLGVTEQTYYRCKRGYGGLRTDQAKRLKDLEKANTRMRRFLGERVRPPQVLFRQPPFTGHEDDGSGEQFTAISLNRIPS